MGDGFDARLAVRRLAAGLFAADLFRMYSRFAETQRWKVRLDVNGRLVKSVFDAIAQEGVNEAFWSGADETGRQVASGVYFYRLRANAEDFSKKMVVVRNGGN